MQKEVLESSNINESKLKFNIIQDEVSVLKKNLLKKIQNEAPTSNEGKSESGTTFSDSDDSFDTLRKKTPYKKNLSTCDQDMKSIKFNKKNTRGRPKGNVTNVIGLKAQKDSKPEKFLLMSYRKKIEMALGWLINKPLVIKNIMNQEYVISIEDIEKISELNDSLASEEFDVNLLRNYCNSDAFNLLKKKIDEKKESDK